MSNSTGTSEAEQSLNTPITEDNLADLFLTAVSEGNDEELDKLFSADISPDAEATDDEDSEEDSPEPEALESQEEPADQVSEESPAPSSTTQEPSPAELRLAQLEKELSDAKASVGRMASLQSRLAQLESKLRQDTAAKQKAAKDEEDSKLQERIAKLREVDPDTADILEALSKSQQRQEVPVKEEYVPDPHISEEYGKVLAVHPDAESIFKHPAWHLWKDTLNSVQRSWAESADSSQVNEALRAFKAFRDGAVKAPAVQAPAAVQEEVVDATQAAREQKLQRSADAGDKPIKKNPKFDENKFFLESYEKIAKESGINY